MNRSAWDLHHCIFIARSRSVSSLSMLLNSLQSTGSKIDTAPGAGSREQQQQVGSALYTAP
jgi:hypothetical protein